MLAYNIYLFVMQMIVRFVPLICIIIVCIYIYRIILLLRNNKIDSKDDF